MTSRQQPDLDRYSDVRLIRTKARDLKDIRSCHPADAQMQSVHHLINQGDLEQNSSLMVRNWSKVEGNCHHIL